MQLEEDEEEFVDTNKLIRTKGKFKTYGKCKELFVELKPRLRTGKCFGAAAMEPTAKIAPTYNVISNDIWFQLSEHIAPESVQAFAMICPATAAIVRRRKFWIDLYQKYCQKSTAVHDWNLQLPEHLQYDNIFHCDTKSLRYRVIESLFYCHAPLIEHLKRNYSLDSLLGYTYVASWYRQYQCVWIMCYKFRQKNYNAKRHLLVERAPTSPTDEINDWESLANEHTVGGAAMSTTTVHADNVHVDSTLLVIICDRFVPFPAHLLYGSMESRVRLQSTRQMLSTDMRGSSLELDFVDGNSRIITTVKYPQIVKCKVLPWWHPDFKKFIK